MFPISLSETFAPSDRSSQNAPETFGRSSQNAPQQPSFFSPTVLSFIRSIPDKQTSDKKEFDSRSKARETPFVQASIPQYIYKYPHITLAVQTNHDIINEWKPDSSDGKYELEARLGLWSGHSFKSGVSKNFVEKILLMFKNSPYWFKISEWEDTHDYYYEGGNFEEGLGGPVHNNNDNVIRIRSTFTKDQLTGNKTIKTEYIKKISIRKINLKFVDGTSGRDQWANDLYDVRVSLNYEKTLTQEEIPECINPSSVRIKNRKSFYYKSDNLPSYDPIWKFDVTRSWTGYSKTDAEHKQRKNESTVYEIELECLNPITLMKCSEKHNSFYVMCSMLLKMADLLNSPTSFRWDPII